MHECLTANNSKLDEIISHPISSALSHGTYLTNRRCIAESTSEHPCEDSKSRFECSAASLIARAPSRPFAFRHGRASRNNHGCTMPTSRRRVTRTGKHAVQNKATQTFVQICWAELPTRTSTVKHANVIMPMLSASAVRWCGQRNVPQNTNKPPQMGAAARLCRIKRKRGAVPVEQVGHESFNQNADSITKDSRV